MAKPQVEFIVMSQLVTQRHPISDTRIRQALKTRWSKWARHKDRLQNVSEAIASITHTMLHKHIGGIVAIRQAVNGHLLAGHTKIFQAKWGHDGIPFIQFDGPGGNYWRVKLSQTHPLLIKNLARIAKKGEKMRAKKAGG